MKKEYVTFVKRLEDLEEGKENDIVVKDLTPGPRKYEAHRVKAIVSSSTEKMADSDTLWVRFAMGVLHPKPWAIKIIQEIKEPVTKR